MADLAFLYDDPKFAFKALLELEPVLHKVFIRQAGKKLSVHLIAPKSFSVTEYIPHLQSLISGSCLLCRPAYIKEKVDVILGLTSHLVESVEKINVWFDIDNLILITLSDQDALKLQKFLWDTEGQLAS